MASTNCTSSSAAQPEIGNIFVLKIFARGFLKKIKKDAFLKSFLRILLRSFEITDRGGVSLKQITIWTWRNTWKKNHPYLVKNGVSLFWILCIIILKCFWFCFLCFFSVLVYLKVDQLKSSPGVNRKIEKFRVIFESSLPVILVDARVWIWKPSNDWWIFSPGFYRWKSTVKWISYMSAPRVLIIRPGRRAVCARKRVRALPPNEIFVSRPIQAPRCQRNVLHFSRPGDRPRGVLCLLRRARITGARYVDSIGKL